MMDASSTPPPMAMAPLPASVHAPFHQIFRARLRPDDLQLDLSDEQNDILNDFEDRWAAFLETQPHLVPQGTREARIIELQNKIHEVDVTSRSVELELQKQLAFFRGSREKLEASFTENTKEAQERQRKQTAEISKYLDTIAIAEHLQQQTLPWQHFMNQLDAAGEHLYGKIGDSDAETGDEKKVEKEMTKNEKPDGIADMDDEDEQLSEAAKRAVKPSHRAMALTDQSSGDLSDISLRAYRIDHALLSTHVAMLQKEIERQAAATEAREQAGKFLTEHNVWSILNKSNASATGGGSTVHVDTATVASASTQADESTTKSATRIDK